MFTVFCTKKNLGHAAALLLFFFLTAIIGQRCEVPASASVGNEGSVISRVLMIDAGHGGLDGGACNSEGIKESAINLAISEKLFTIARLVGCRAIMTRESEELNYPDDAATVSAKKTWDQKRRVELINSFPDAVLISVHQNMFPDPRPKGAQVLYASDEMSKEFGELAHGLLVSSIDPENRRVAAPISDSIYLMKNVHCPAILVECGFLSHPEEALMLTDTAYQMKLAVVLAAAYLQYAF